jgi:hypothetical protein
MVGRGERSRPKTVRLARGGSEGSPLFAHKSIRLGSGRVLRGGYPLPHPPARTWIMVRLVLGEGPLHPTPAPSQGDADWILG